MLASSIPTKFPIPWGASAGGAYIRPIPVASQIGVNPGFASLTDGYVPLNMTPVASGGIPPFGQDMNGILNQITLWNQWNEAGGPIGYDGTFSTAIGGYPNGAVIASADVVGQYWYSIVDNNTSDPDTGGDNWIALGIATTGDIKWRASAEVLPGWAKANATTIGNVLSFASQYASAAMGPLFEYLWNNFSNTQCPVSGGRGASAAADFAARKTIGVLDMRGRGNFGMDTMGGAATTLLAGVPVTVGNNTTAGSVLGENFHALTSGENGTHSHTASVTDGGHLHSLASLLTSATITAVGATAGFEQYAKNVTANNNTAAAATGISVSNANSGSGTPHNNVPLVTIGTYYIKI